MIVPDTHRVHSDFAREMESLLARCFRRDAALWPVYRDAALAGMIDERRRHCLPPDERLAAYPARIPGEKALFFNPHCTYGQIDAFVERLNATLAARDTATTC